MKNIMWKFILINSLLIFLFACAELEPQPFEPSTGHITAEEQPIPAEIPELAQTAPILPIPEPPVELEKYTVVVNEVPVKELLFALARDAQINVDIVPSIEGVVTINAVDQTLPQILARVARQVNIRYIFEDDYLLIQPDEPYFKIYNVDYVNIRRDTISTNAIATNLANVGTDVGEGGGGGAFSGNNSTTDVNTESLNQFWSSITNSIIALLGGTPSESGGGLPITESVIPSPDTSVITVLATEKQHAEVQQFLDLVMANVRRQVLIQVTIVEVTLTDEYRAGIDWDSISFGNFVITAATLGGPVTAAISGAAGLVGTFETDNTSATVQLLDEFGDTTVLSSPQLMVLNNQTAILKRLENRVFFTIDSEAVVGGLQTTQSFDTTIHTLPIGIVMTITPHIAKNDEIILFVRPTISREAGDPVPIPVPGGTGQGVITLPENSVPQTVSQEMESLIRLNSGQIAVLGGFMEDRTFFRDTTIPGVSTIPLVGEFFRSVDRDVRKVETVIFIRPLVVVNPSIETDLEIYKHFLDPKYIKESVSEGRSL